MGFAGIQQDHGNRSRDRGSNPNSAAVLASSVGRTGSFPTADCAEVLGYILHTDEKNPAILKPVHVQEQYVECTEVLRMNLAAARQLGYRTGSFLTAHCAEVLGYILQTDEKNPAILKTVHVQEQYVECTEGLRMNLAVARFLGNRTGNLAMTAFADMDGFLDNRTWNSSNSNAAGTLHSFASRVRQVSVADPSGAPKRLVDRMKCFPPADLADRL